MIRISHKSLLGGWVVLMGIGLAFLGPLGAWRMDLDSSVKALRIELAKPVDGPDVVERLANDLKTLREFGQGRMTPIPEQSDVAGLMSILSDTLTDLGLEKRDITVRPPKSYGDPPEASSLPVTLVLHGSFVNVCRAVERVESMPRLVRVERLRAVADERQTGTPSREGLVRSDLSIEAFYGALSNESRRSGDGRTP